MMKSTKKGFTLVELLVVIAILAILATVSVVGYTAFVERANRSIDEQVVAQLNNFVLGYLVETPNATAQDVLVALVDDGAMDFELAHKNHSLAWDYTNKRIVLVENNQVVYPESCKRPVDSTVVELSLPQLVDDATTLANSISNLAQGTIGYFLVDGNANTASPIVVGAQNFVLDGKNAGTITAPSSSAFRLTENGANVVVQNLTIDVTASTNDNTVANSAFSIYKTSNVTLNNVVFSSTYCTLSSYPTDGIDNPTVKVTNSTFTAPTPLFITEGTWYFQNCTFNGCVNVFGGDVTFVNCTFVGIGEGYYNNEEEAKSAEYGPVDLSGHAICIIQGRENEECKNGQSSVNFVDCTISGEYFFGTCTHATAQPTNTIVVTGTPRNV
ncbi:MAG: prepilin-type N-terminal cleavage/methylation domain-containing protein [Clostridia bacterium]|nr:prepilin-type N-terminal cleavage/methylation domain-containing protein [Clostridia bacterium]